VVSGDETALRLRELLGASRAGRFAELAEAVGQRDLAFLLRKIVDAAIERGLGVPGDERVTFVVDPAVGDRLLFVTGSQVIDLSERPIDELERRDRAVIRGLCKLYAREIGDI
jgi:hypothetical protein